MVTEQTNILGSLVPLQEGSGIVTKLFGDMISPYGGTTLNGAIAGLAASPLTRATQPFESHAWIYAAVMAIARNRGQAEYGVYLEIEEEAKQDPRFIRPVIRKLTKKSAGGGTGSSIKNYEKLPDHKLAKLLAKPNAVMDGSQLWHLTDLWMSLRGEVFWIFLDENGDLIPYTDAEQATEIWPISPDLVTPIIIGTAFMGWRINFGYGISGQKSAFVNVYPEDIIQFKWINPRNPFRGLSPLVALASTLVQDLAAKDQNRESMANNAEPGGILSNENYNPFANKDDEQRFKKGWDERHRGSDNARRVSILTGGWKFTPMSFSPKDMEFIEQLRWNREEILGVLGVPKSVLSITDNLNYATQMAQDRNFWDKLLLPITLYYERTLDATLFCNRKDHVTGMFDLSQIDALRFGQSEKIDVARKLVGADLRVPPNIAYDMVGLDVPDYPTKDISYVAPGPVRAESLDEAPPAAPAPGGFGGGGFGGGGAPAPAAPPAPGIEQSPGLEVRPALGQATIIRALSGRQKKKSWKEYIKRCQRPVEREFQRAWMTWVEAERRNILRNFDMVTRAIASPIDKVLADLEGMRTRLGKVVKPSYMTGLEKVYDYTMEEVGGVPLFEIDDEIFADMLEEREDILLESAPKTLQESLRKTINSGLEKNESISTLRDRIAATLGTAGSAAKALSIARTESNSFVSSIRDQMFEKQGFTEEEWTTAGDEHVREDHIVFGEAGPKPRGFNYMTLVNKSGILKFPGDMAAPAGQVINCRCVKIPIG